MKRYRVWPFAQLFRTAESTPLPATLLLPLIGLTLLLPAQPAAGQTTRMLPPPPTTQRAAPSTRPARDILQDFRTAGEQLRAVMPSAQILGDEDQRARIAPQAVPALWKMVAAMEELATTQPAATSQPAQVRYQLLAILSTLGDVRAVALLKSAAEGQNTADAVAARSAQVLVKWWRAGGNAPAQAKVLDEAQALVHAHPDNDSVAATLKLIADQGAASPQLQQRIQSIITQDLKGPDAQRLSRHLQDRRKLQDLLDKPLTLAGTTAQGATLSTAAWHGKLILVYFWATWCPPALEELPRLKQLYRDYHARGLEILGISCDGNADDLKAFLQQNPDIPWPQLFDPAANPAQRWHPLARDCGVTALPTFLLIDQSGVLRSIDARDDLEQAIPRMLENRGQGSGDRGQ